MIVKKNSILSFLVLSTLLFTSCKDGNSIFNPDYESPNARPVVTSISPAGNYLAGVDSVIVTGTGFSSVLDEMTINFGGSAGVVKVASETELIVRPGTIAGESLPVFVSRRGAEFLSEEYSYTLRQPQGIYPGVTADFKPVSPAGVDSDNNIYVLADQSSSFRLFKISPDGTVEVDGVKNLGEFKPDDTPYPADSTLSFPASSYTDIEVGTNGQLFMTTGSVQAIFLKTFGDDKREGLWGFSSTNTLKIGDIVFDDNGFLWVVGKGSNQIHRFNVSDKNETKIPFPGELNAVAFYEPDNELYVGGLIDGTQKVWKFDIDGSGNIGAGELYFDYAANYEGNVTSLILASNGELLIGNSGETGIVRVFPSLVHEPFYPGMIKPGTFSITWRDDEFAVVGVKGEDASLNFMDMYDRTRAGIFGF